MADLKHSSGAMLDGAISKAFLPMSAAPDVLAAIQRGGPGGSDTPDSGTVRQTCQPDNSSNVFTRGC